MEFTYEPPAGDVGAAFEKLTGRDLAITSGWFALVPRGTSFTLTRKGRNPAIVLQTTGGQPCSTLSAQK